MPLKKPFHDAPTPWMTVNNPYDTQMQWRFRIFLRRRGGALHVQTHRTSLVEPARTLTVRASKPGFFEFVKASHGLLRIAVWDKTCAPGVRAVWSPTAPEIALRMEYATTVAAFLPRIFAPTTGRPRQGALGGIGAQDRPAPRNAFATARRVQRESLLLMTQSITNILLPVIDQMKTTRAVVLGYTRAETQRLHQHLSQLLRTNQFLRDEVFSDNLVTTAASMRAYHDATPPERNADGTIRAATVDLSDVEVPEPQPVAAEPLVPDATDTMPSDEALARAQREFNELLGGAA